MLDLQELQILAQLVDNMDIMRGELERKYEENDGESFNKYKREILNIQKKISEMIE